MRIVPGKLEELPESAWDTTMNIGLKAAFLVSQAAAKHMIPQQVRDALSTSRRLRVIFPYNWAGAYSVVKAGLLMLTKLQALEWAPYGIRANAITPGYIRTPGTEAMYADPEIYEGTSPRRSDGTRGERRRHHRGSRFSRLCRCAVHVRQRRRRRWRAKRSDISSRSRSPFFRRPYRLRQCASLKINQRGRDVMRQLLAALLSLSVVFGSASADELLKRPEPTCEEL